ITEELIDGAGELIVRVEAPLDKLAIPHGKQRSRPHDDYNDCAFTASSGIWQSVWLEGRPSTYIEQVQLRSTNNLDGIQVRVVLNGPYLDGAALFLEIAGGSGQIIPVKGSEIAVTLSVDHPQHWSPRTPHLYTVIVRLRSADGEDKVSSYTGLRK